jgi:hypothetical protein
MRRPEPLGPQHQLEGFDCGNAALNRWLQQRALANARQGVSRTVVVCDALRRSMAARRLIGARALLVHAIDEQAAAFYRSLGFRPSPLSASTLMLQLSEPDG